jgi:hemoglobin
MVVGLLVASRPLWAGEDKPAAPPLDRKTLDDLVNRTLRDIINRGAALYNNQGDYSGCYRLWEGALLMVRPFLDHRPELQKAIDAGLLDAQRNPQLERRAFVLRAVMDKIRDEVRGPGMAKGTAPSEEGKAPRKETSPEKEGTAKGGAAAPADKKLWDRLGGEEGVRKVVDEFVNTAGKDPKVNFFRDPNYKPKAKEIDDLKKNLVDFISDKTGGPYKYEGKGMRVVHAGMRITNAEFDATVKHLKDALEKYKVAPADEKTILDAVEETRRAIVEEPKEGEKKASEGTVQGIVTLDGKPLAKGTIKFVPATGEAVSGPIGADGKYKVTGLKPGKYKVTVESADKDLIPAKYSDPEKSALTFEATGSDQNNADFFLKSK